MDKQIRTAPHGGRHHHAPVQKTPAKYAYEELLRLQQLSLRKNRMGERADFDGVSASDTPEGLGKVLLSLRFAIDHHQYDRECH